MKVLLKDTITLMACALLMMLPGLLAIVISVMAPVKSWSRMENETNAQYCQRMQLQAITFRSRAR